MHSKIYFHFRRDDTFRVERLPITGTVAIGVRDPDGSTDPVTLFVCDEHAARALVQAATDAARLFGIADVEPEQCGAVLDWAGGARCEGPVGHGGEHGLAFQAS